MIFFSNKTKPFSCSLSAWMLEAGIKSTCQSEERKRKKRVKRWLRRLTKKAQHFHPVACVKMSHHRGIMSHKWSTHFSGACKCVSNICCTRAVRAGTAASPPAGQCTGLHLPPPCANPICLPLLQKWLLSLPLEEAPPYY